MKITAIGPPRSPLRAGSIRATPWPRLVEPVMAVFRIEVKAFPWRPMKALKKVGDIPVLYEKDGRMVYEVYHFSCYGWQSPMLNRQISQITAIAQSIL